MKRNACKIFILVMLFSLFAGCILPEGGGEFLGEYTDDKGDVYKSYKSRNGLYTYVEMPGGEISIEGYWGNKESITIPETIDGKKVTSSCMGIWWEGEEREDWRPRTSNLRRITYGSNIKKIGDFELAFYLSDSDSKRKREYLGDVTELNFSEGLEEIRGGTLIHLRLEKLVLPKSLKKVSEWAFGSGLIVPVIVFLGNPALEEVSLQITYRAAVQALGKPVEIYFYDDATNVSEAAFASLGHDTEHSQKYVIIYHKPGAKGFEKFIDLGYDVRTFTDGEGPV